MAPNEQFGSEDTRSPLEPQQRFSDISATEQREASYRPTIPPTPRTTGESGGQAGGVQQGSQPTTERLKQKGREATQRIRQEGTSLLSEQKGRAADELSHFSHAIHRAAESLHSEEDHRIGDYVDTVAQGVDQAANYLRSNEIGAFVEDAERFARRRPEIVFGGLFIAGLVMSRFLKSSSRHRDVGTPGFQSMATQRQDVAPAQHQGAATNF